MKDWWKSRTVWVNAITLAVGVVTIVAGSDLIPPQAVAIMGTIVLPLLNMILRWLTDQPITSFAPGLDKLRRK